MYMNVFFEEHFYNTFPLKFWTSAISARFRTRVLQRPGRERAILFWPELQSTKKYYCTLLTSAAQIKRTLRIILRRHFDQSEKRIDFEYIFQLRGGRNLAFC